MTDTPPVPGRPETVAEDVRRILAANPSPMTHCGTNTYLVGSSELAVIDPGPDDPAHLDALMSAIGRASIRAILVTHAHLDHAALAPRLSQITGAEVLAFGDARAGRSAIMRRLAQQGLSGGGEGVMHDFKPDRRIGDGAVISGEGWALSVLHTPGHIGNHVCLLGRDYGFSGDHVMGWASTLISPPDGDVGDFMRSCARLRAASPPLLLPGHGPAIGDPESRIHWLMAHRRTREEDILARLEAGPASAATLTAAIYADTPPALLPAAGRNVFAHLVDLHERGLVKADPAPLPDAVFTLG